MSLKPERAKFFNISQPRPPAPLEFVSREISKLGQILDELT